MKNLLNFLCILVFFSSTNGELVDIDSNNIETVLNSHELVFINFYADWCRFSRMLAPIFKAASDEAIKKFPQTGLVALGRVDCDKNPDIAQRFSVNKYPTMKLFRNGQMTKREYRGQRSADALVNFLKEQMKDPIHHFATEEEMDDFEARKRSIIGYFSSKDSKDYETFEKIAKSLKEDCDFFVAIGDVSSKERQSGDNIIFRPTGGDPDMVYLGSLSNHDLLKAWSTDKCVPLVREITFQNGEELTEEGLPFLILFHKKEDTESLELYKKVLSRNLIHEKARVNFLEADCDTFSHPLHHLGKSTSDCPLIAIDSFKHMYLFPHFNDLSVPGKLKSFLEDLHSGKLHREFHHGPDQADNAAKENAPPPPLPSLTPEIKEHIRKQGRDPDEIEKQAQDQFLKQQKEATKDKPKLTTAKSVFKNLMPSERRYTLMDRVKDEL
uniref:endoplasmic reticulum resident protein 44-like isoform X1 n=1 Tax=Styela clava TaxID=7725 RepID=UPI00193A5F04|nr:endoplasmic reticulum resident protein 44-like isoform X1 [Styela clava]